MKKITNLLKNILMVSIMILLSTYKASAQDAPDTVKIGSYIISLHDINFKDKEYTIRFWLWMIYKNKEFDFANRVEVPNAKLLEKPDVFEDSTDGKNWVLLKMKCTMKNAWKVNDFPFDKQQLKVRIENAAYDNKSLIFLPDNKGTHIDPELAVDGWKISNLVTDTKTSIYNSAFGDSRLSNPYSEYDSYEISFEMEREAWGLFLKIFIGMYVAFMIGFVSFFIHLDHIEASFGLQVGGLFAAVGNKYISESSLPETTSFTLVDTLHAVTFIYLFFIIFSSVVTLRYYKTKRSRQSRKINYTAAMAILGSYLLINLLIVFMAVHDYVFF